MLGAIHKWRHLRGDGRGLKKWRLWVIFKKSNWGDREWARKGGSKTGNFGWCHLWMILRSKHSRKLCICQGPIINISKNGKVIIQFSHSLVVEFSHTKQYCVLDTWCTAFKSLEKEFCHALGGLSNHVLCSRYFLNVAYQWCWRALISQTQNMPQNCRKVSRAANKAGG